MKKLIIILLIILTVYAFYSIYTHRTPHKEGQAEITPLPIEVHTEGIKEPEEPKFTDEDIILIAKVVYAESRGECDEGQRAVARVILNRVESELYPDTVSEVIKQQGQFVIGSRYTEKEMRNVEYVLENGFDMPADVMYFRKGPHYAVWKKIGNHLFCTKG